MGGDLPFNFTSGSCRDYTINGEDIVLLCFGNSDRKTCNRFDGTDFTELGIDSNYGHDSSYFSTYQSKPFITGGCDDDIRYHTKVEILEDGKKWIQMADYPYGSQL